jgi:hypothetical protein
MQIALCTLVIGFQRPKEGTKMKLSRGLTLSQRAGAFAAIVLIAGMSVNAQTDAPPVMAPAQLDNLVSRIALYPDPLLAQVLAAATFPDQIPQAAGFADQNRGLTGDALANAIGQANLPFDPSVQSLIPFPTVLDMMAQDTNWTAALGNAVLAQRPDVMDAVQRMRFQAQRFGYLQSTAQARVVAQPQYIEILPVNPAFVYVPIYNPLVVFAAPRPGFFIGGAIRFSAGFVIGPAFHLWGWGGGFNWYGHALVFNHVAWGRTWVNRGTYVHNWGNWNGGRYPHYATARNVTVNRNVKVNRNVNVNRNVDVNRNVNANRNEPNRSEPNRNEAFNRNAGANHAPQAHAAAPNRAPEHHAAPEHAARPEHAAGHEGHEGHEGGSGRGGRR